jgi:hypothetical protein
MLAGMRGLCCGLLLVMGFGVGACCYRDRQMRAISGQYGAPGGSVEDFKCGRHAPGTEACRVPSAAALTPVTVTRRLGSVTGVDQIIVSGYAGLANRRSGAMLPGWRDMTGREEPAAGLLYRPVSHDASCGVRGDSGACRKGALTCGFGGWA